MTYTGCNFKRVLRSLIFFGSDIFLLIVGQTTLLDVLRGICSGLRPGISEKFIPSNLPERNRLLNLIALCWHQEPDYRPHTAGNIQDLLSVQDL